MATTARRQFRLAEVATHCTPQDCWVVVHGQVYDVTKYVPRHPGGALIYIKAGGDCSHLFDSYHPPGTSRILEKYRIGALDPCESLSRYEQQGTSDTFFVALKFKVDKYFRDHKIDPRFSTSMYIKSVCIILTVALAACVSFYWATSYTVALLSATVLGIGMAEVGISIQHDANHGAFSRNRWLCYWAGLTLDAVGASSFMWKQQHVVGHHVFTNVNSEDPDIRVTDDGQDMRRVTHWQSHGAHHQYQHVYLAALYGLLAIKSIFVDDFVALARGAIGPVKLARLTSPESAAFWAGKAVFGLWFLAAPAAYSHWNVAQLLGIWAWALAWTGWTLAFMFQVAHVVDDVKFLEKDPSGEIQGSWAAQQVATSADFCHGSWFWTHLSGGLNYQVVHHLFPGIIHTHYPAIAPIVQETAAEFGIPYKVYPTFWTAIRAHFKHLQIVGTTLPSLQTIG